MSTFRYSEGSGNVPHRHRHLQSASEGSQQDEATKKILRGLSETSKRIDDQTRRCQNVVQVLSGPELLSLRNRLRSLMLKLLQSESTGSGLKTIELDWRKCSYEPITAAKRIKKGTSVTDWTREEKVYLQTHLLNGVGHYHNFLMWIQTNFGTLPENGEDLRATSHEKNAGGSANADFDFSQVRAFETELISAKKKMVDKVWLEQVIHRCLMCLGDLSRYQLEVTTGDDRTRVSGISQRYYHQALALQPNIGLPYNQLATLAVDLNFGLNSVFYYLRSLTVKDQFEGSEANLRQFLERKSLKFSRLVTPAGNGEENDEPTSGNEAEMAVLHLLHLAKELLFEESTRKLPQLCQHALKCVQRCLYVQQGSDVTVLETEITQPFNEEIATKMVLVLMLLMIKLQEKGQEKKLSMVQAYLFALTTHFVSKLLADLQFSFFGPEAMLKNFQPKEVENDGYVNDAHASERDYVVKIGNGNCQSKNSNDDGCSTDEGSVEKRSKASKSRRSNMLNRLRRKRRKPKSAIANGRSDSESGLDYSSDDSERGVRSRHLSGGSSDSLQDPTTDDESFGSDDDIIKTGILESDSYDSDDVTSEDDDDVIIESCQVIISVDELVAKVRDHHLVEAIRICALWLMSSRDLVVDAGPNANILWQRLVSLFNTLNFNDNKYKMNTNMSQALLRCRAAISSKPISEDFQSRGIKFFEKRQQSLHWKDQEFLSSYDLGVYRILQFFEFRDWLCQIRETKIEIDHVSENVQHVARSNQKPEISKPEMIENGKLANNDENKHRMMQNMAQLWLQQEVKELEGVGGVGAGRLSSYSLYLIIDHLALIRHLALVREIVDARKFAVVIPATVVQELDAVKRSENGARNAIRWLEREFKEGNCWLRAQKPDEFKTLESIPYPNKKDEKAKFRYFKILECCNFFSNVSDNSTHSVTLLTSYTQDKRDGKDTREADEIRPPKSVANSLNIHLEDISKFADIFKIKPTHGNRRFRRNRPRADSDQEFGSKQERSNQSRHRNERRKIRKDNG